MNSELWQTIIAFDLDHPISAYGFSTRLASEQGWTINFTQAAILEYKKFMFLAASYERMVAPSEIVDTVWHQHLIFTQSYQNFCTLLGKQIQHIPSTHRKEEAVKFKQAILTTKQLYDKHFGEPPASIWFYSNMYNCLNLRKNRLGMPFIISLSLLLFLGLIYPCYVLLYPIYIKIDNPDFLLFYIAFIVSALIALEILNRSKLRQMVRQFDRKSFLFHLHPLEMIYLKNQKLTDVIHGVVNPLIVKGFISIHKDNTIEKIQDFTPATPEEYQTQEVFDHLGKTYYPNVIKELVKKPVFMNIAKSMDGFKIHFNTSSKFLNLFCLNLFLFLILLMPGIIRLLSGYFRGLPIAYILLTVIVMFFLLVSYFQRLMNLMCIHTLPSIYRKEVLPAQASEMNWLWRFFLSGNTILAFSFIQLVNYVDKNSGSGGDGGTSCGSSCGSSCGGCGGD